MAEYRKYLNEVPEYIASLQTQNGYVYWVDKIGDKPYLLLRQAGPFVEKWQAESQEWINAPWEVMELYKETGPDYRTVSPQQAAEYQATPGLLGEMTDEGIQESMQEWHEELVKEQAGRAREGVGGGPVGGIVP